MQRTIDNLVIWILVIICIIPTLIAVPVLLALDRIAGRATYNILLAIDAYWNVLSRGDPFETISARAWRNRTDRRWAMLVWVLGKLQKDHCKVAYQMEMARAETLLRQGA